MTAETNWYVLYTRPKWEKKVAGQLARMEITNYCPLNKVHKQWHDRKKWVDEPLFPSYVFVQTSLKQHSYIREVPGVLSFISWLGKAAVVKQSEIDAIRDFLTKHRNVQLEKVSLRTSDLVRIADGPLANMEGKVVQVSANTVKVSIPSLGYALVAEVARTNLVVIQPPSQSGLANKISA
ncbi:transcription antitermination protein nusG [Cnuella takakiae]|uniref:Transcription antitermination protein nusG n=1 Tax=Cnuella takakiae TaxID=1302690 RepID=A0A1M5E144_9BACT|nr:UpxY family transcription antiterminator [Cnuella takakiae]OLY93806.1 antitermination protein NusG [Cnuella takakiae]SHF72953.1 transcription antitermination protein nusG [Cnuella takakiae]